MHMRSTVSALVATLFVTAAIVAAEPQHQDAVQFNRDIRPILSTSCLNCHGPDEGGREADLRLDLRDAATGELGGTIAIVPGAPDESPLIERVDTDDEDLRMPPAESGSSLSAEERGLLRRWIKQGATYEEHWSFVAPDRSPIPDVSDSEWPRRTLDYFVLARLDEEGLSPTVEANRRTLIRRVALALTGLPPTPEEVNHFLADQSVEADETMVDHYLASNAFGERWAAVWLDLARYADSAGYAQDPERTIWPYRDWVISAINQNMSFAQFTIEQIAGDMLPNPSAEQLIATGFHRNTMTNSEGGTDDEEFRNAAIVDRTNTTMQTWMGITLGCAQCHDHKYDPIRTDEYYSVFAIFNQSEDSDKPDERPTLSITTDDIRERRDELAKRIDDVEKRIAEKVREQNTAAQSGLIGPLTPRFVRVELPGEDRILSIAEVQVISSGTNIAIEGTATQSSTGFNGPAQLAIDGNSDGDFFSARSTTHNKSSESDPWWEVDLGRESGIDRIAIFNRTDHDLYNRMKDGRIVLLNSARQVMGLYPLPDPPAPSFEFEPASNASDLSEADRNAIAAYQGAGIKPDDDGAKQLAELKKKLESVKPYTTPIMRELADDKHRVTHVQVRGNWLNKGKEVSAGVPELFHALPEGATADRLDLARWLVDRKNPLTARVIVNRFWDQLFGQGLVATAEEFGSQGTPPTHPGLLDHLAIEFMEHDWNVKWLLKEIVSSATYRQSAQATDELLEKDPANKLLARGPRFRLSAEMVRDQALAVSGLLSRKMYGPPVNPPRPNLGLRSAFGGLTDWTTSPGEDRFRRAIYTNWRRTTPYPSMTTFDAPSREYCEIRRVQTNTPLQALVTLNDPVYIEAAQSLARRINAEGGKSTESRIAFAVELCLARPPQEAESKALTELYRRTKNRLVDRPEDALALATDPLGPLEKNQDATELAAWTVVGNVLLNLDEFLMRP